MKKFEGKPFAIVGVNSDSDREKVKHVMAKEKLGWRSFWDGGSTEGPIQSKWNVQGYPTMYVIDHNGVIAAKYWADEKGEELIARKVKEAETASQK